MRKFSRNKMDKSQVIGLVLIFALFFGWTYTNSKSREALEVEQAKVDSITQVNRLAFMLDSTAKAQQFTPQTNTSLPAEIAATQDSFQDIRLMAQYGVFNGNAKGEEQEYVLENEKVKVIFSSVGGKIKEVEIKGYKKVFENEAGEKEKAPVRLLNNEKNRFSYLLPVKGVPGNQIDTEDLNFIAKKTGNTIEFVAGENGEFVQKYTLNDAYDIDYALAFNNGSDIFKSNEPIQIKWNNYLDKVELNDYFERFYSTVYFKENGENSDYCNCRSADIEEAKEKPIDWISHSNQFFNTSLIAKGEGFENGTFETVVLDEEDKDLKFLKTELSIPASAISNGNYNMSLVAAPNDFNLLKSYDIGLEEIIPFGRSIFGTINRWVIRPLFNFFDGIVGNKGIAIILMILLIKVCLYPLTYKMLHSQAKMGALKPELKQLKEKYKDDAQTTQVETMKIYREYGVSPLGGCMPMVIQMPIWYALFRFFPASIGFRQESFLWADDLSSFDALIQLPFEIPFMGSHLSMFTILWVITQLIYTYYNTKHMDMSANPAMKYIQYVMPIMFLAFFNQYASGLTVYMFFSNLFNIFQTVGTKKWIFNEDKLRQELMANKLKPKKKKSKFMQNIESAVNEQKEIKKKQGKGKK